MENHIFSADTHSQKEVFADGFDSFSEETGDDDVFFNSRGKRLKRKAAKKTRKAARKMRRATRAEMKGKHKKAARLRGKAQKKLDKASNKLDRLKSQDQLLKEQQALQDKAQSGGGSGGGGGDDSGGGGEAPAQVEQQPLQDQGGAQAPQEQYQPQQQSGGGSGGSGGSGGYGGGGIDDSSEEEEPQEEQTIDDSSEEEEPQEEQTIDELIGEQEEQEEQEVEEQNADDFETAVGLHTGRHGEHHKKGLHKKHKLPVKELLADDFQSAIGLHVGRIEHKKMSLAMLVYHSKNEQQGRAYIAGHIKGIATFEKKLKTDKKVLQQRIDHLKKSIAEAEKVFAAKYKKSYSNAEGDHFKELLADDFQSAIGLHVGRNENKKLSLAMLVYHSKNEQQGRAYIAGHIKGIATFEKKLKTDKKVLQQRIDHLKKSIAEAEKVFAAKYKKSYSNAEGDHFSAGEKVFAKSFFEKNKKALLIGAGVVAGAFLLLKFGKKLMK